MRTSDPCDGECMCSKKRRLEWKTSTAEEFADVIEDLCVEKDGKCQVNPCQCKRNEPKERDVW